MWLGFERFLKLSMAYFDQNSTIQKLHSLVFIIGTFSFTKSIEADHHDCLSPQEKG